MFNYKKLSFILSTLVLSFLVGYLALAAWTDAPTETPPNCPSSHQGCSPPINVDGISQTKGAGLVVKGDLTANKLVDYNNITYYIDPANTEVAGVLAGNVGIGVIEPKTELDVAEIIKISYEYIVCDTSIAGAIRYNSGKFEGCDGEKWRVIYELRPSPKERAQSGALTYCENKFGTTFTLYGDTVYCDSYGNMWAPTLTTESGVAKAYQWSTEKVNITTYEIPNDCNEIPLEHLDKYPACNACATLNYAGFSEGWRLPYHSENNKGGYSCYWDSQLWNYGRDLCVLWGGNCNANPGPCAPDWEGYHVISGHYWSAVQYSQFSSWGLSFHNSQSDYYGKEQLLYVRCFLGEW